MEPDFWIKRWENGETGFHGTEANPLLVKYFEKLTLTPGNRVFVPLCGKSLDLAWLLAQGLRVAGAELTKLAVEQFFENLKVTPEISMIGTLQHYRAPNLDIFQGNIFDVTREILGPVDAIYDRAALVALPQPMRVQYTSHLMQITNNARQLLICYEYDQSSMEGPPFCVPDAEVRKHYENTYELTLESSEKLEGGLKGKIEALEKIWVLKKK
jgi:thiopurine S-methyltransferase